MEVIVMKKKFVVAVAAVVMAAVMSVSAFAADGVTVPSISGGSTGSASEIFVPQSNAEASATANAAYNTSHLLRAALPIS